MVRYDITYCYCNYFKYKVIQGYIVTICLRSEQISKNIMCSDMLKSKPFTENMNPRGNH